MIQITIRNATVEDAEAIAHLSAQTFRDTFATDSNATDIDLYLKAAFSIQQVEAELASDSSTFLLAYVKDSGSFVGYAKIRVGRKEPCVIALNPIEIERLYVDKAAIGQGVGAKLMQACLKKADSQGCDVVWLGVWEHNHRAIGFYKKWNFSVVGSHVFKLGTDEQNDLIMQRPIKD